MIDPDTLRHGLEQFTGSEVIFRHGLNRRVLYTEGVKHFAEKAEAYWLLDIFATQPEILLQQQYFAVMRLTVRDSEALLVVTDGNESTPPAYTRKFDFTTCPEGEWMFFMHNDTVMLPGEY